MKTLLPHSAIALACALAFASMAATASDAKPAAGSQVVVNVDNFNRAQTDREYAGTLKMTGGINNWSTTARRHRSTSRASSA